MQGFGYLLRRACGAYLAAGSNDVGRAQGFFQLRPSGSEFRLGVDHTTQEEQRFFNRGIVSPDRITVTAEDVELLDRKSVV